MEKRILDFLSKHDYDVRKSGNARWIDQKCTIDVVSFIADCIINYVDEFGNYEFSTRDIWDYEFAEKTIKDIFRKPSTNSPLSQNEYDKFFSQPLELLAYSKILIKIKRGTRNYYRVSNRELLEFISIKEYNSLEFIYLYSKKVLNDSNLWTYFNHFFETQTQNSYIDLKTKFEEFTIMYTPINTEREVRRIFTKILNPIAFKLKKLGTYRGRISRQPISYSELMYNRANFRDVWSDKPKDITRQEWIKEIGKDVNKAYYHYQSSKAKRFLKKYNDENRDGLSELTDKYNQGKATQIHHIFPESEFPMISSYLENLVALTPTQHLYKAHPNNNTSIIDYDYQELLLKTKAKIIDENVRETSPIYSYDNFSTVLNTGFYKEEYISVENYECAMLLIQSFYGSLQERRKL